MSFKMSVHKTWDKFVLVFILINILYNKQKAFWLDESHPSRHSHSIRTFLSSLRVLNHTVDNKSSRKELIQQPVVKYLMLYLLRTKEQLLHLSNNCASVCSSRQTLRHLKPERAWAKIQSNFISLQRAECWYACVWFRLQRLFSESRLHSAGHALNHMCVCVEQIKRVSVYKSSVMRHSCSRAQQYPCHRAAASNKFLHESKAQRMQKMLCDNFYKACCDQWGVSSLWLHGKCFANEHRRRDTQRAPRADRRPTTTTVIACGSAHLCEKGFA